MSKKNGKRMSKKDVRKRKRRINGTRPGSIAIPFLLTVLVSFTILGGIILPLGLERYAPKTDTGNNNTASGFYSPTSEDDMTILLVIDMEDDGKSPFTFVVIRSIPFSKGMIMVPLRSDSSTTINGFTDTIGNFYKTEKMVYAKQAAEQILGVTIDRCIKCTQSVLIELYNVVFTRVTYSVPKDFIEAYGEGDATLTFEQMMEIINKQDYSNGEADRIIHAGSILSGMINQSSGTSIALTLGDTFMRMSETVETDITIKDYRKYEKAVKFMLESGKFHAKLRFTEGGLDADGNYAVSDLFREKIKKDFQL